MKGLTPSSILELELRIYVLFIKNYGHFNTNSLLFIVF